MEVNKIYEGDCLEGLKTLPDECVDCCVTSPPYFGLRDYGHDGQIGLEETPEKYVQKMVEVFTEVKRVLKKEGTLWLNLGDSYAGSGIGTNDYRTEASRSINKTSIMHPKKTVLNKLEGIKPKDLIGIPWTVAFALRYSGWYLRQDIIWHKPNPMPESVTDRCTKAHEYIFLLSKSAKYYYDATSIKQPLVEHSTNVYPFSDGSKKETMFKQRGLSNEYIKAYKHRGTGDKKPTGHSGNYDAEGNLIGDGMANKRSVWTVTTKPFSEAHFATFPEDLIVDCIKAGCPENGIVLDPFMGAGTTALVASKLNRNFIGFELNADYIEIIKKRLQGELGMFNKLIA
jgi:DNA modification methylase